MRAIFLSLFLTFLLFSTLTQAKSFLLGKEAQLIVVVKDVNGNTLSASCRGLIYYPNKTIFLNTTLSLSPTGTYYTSYTLPDTAPVGVYEEVAICNVSVNRRYKILKAYSYFYAEKLELEIENVTNITVNLVGNLSEAVRTGMSELENKLDYILTWNETYFENFTRNWIELWNYFNCNNTGGNEICDKLVEILNKVTEINETTTSIENYIINLNSTFENTYEIEISCNNYYTPDERIEIYATLLKNGITVNNQVVHINITKNRREIKSGTMQFLGNGIYFFNLTAPSSYGDYLINITYGNTAKASKFKVSNILERIEIMHEETQETLEKEIETEIETQTKEMRDFATGAITFLNSNFFKGLILLIIIGTVYLLIRHFSSGKEEEEYVYKFTE